MGKKGNQPKVNYTSSPQQQQMLSYMMPLYKALMGYGMGNLQYGQGGGFAGQSQAPGGQPAQAPNGGMSPWGQLYTGNVMDYGGTGNTDGAVSAQNTQGALMGGLQPPQAQGGVGAPTSLYQLPNAPMPTAGWYESIAPEVMEGLWEPYNDAANQLKEQMNYQGSLGSGGQFTGNAWDNMGDFYSKAGTQIGQQAWNMMSPGMTQNYNSQLGMLTMPYQMLGMTPQFMPTGMVSQGAGNPMGGMFSGGLSGALAGSMIPGLGTGIGGGLGALAGLFGG